MFHTSRELVQKLSLCNGFQRCFSEEKGIKIYMAGNSRMNHGRRVDFWISIGYHTGMAKKTEHVSSYFAVFDSAQEGGYNVSFPDFPGCVTFGKTFEESKKNAQEILELWLEDLASGKKAIPRYTSRPIIDEVKVAVRI